MSFQDLLRDTLTTLWAHKRRTLLTMFGIAWGIISITLMVAASEGLGQGIEKQHRNFGKDVMIVFAGRTSMQAGGTRSGRAIHWGEDDYLKVAAESPACAADAAPRTPRARAAESAIRVFFPLICNLLFCLLTRFGCVVYRI